jgi:hypothetical protein
MKSSISCFTHFSLIMFNSQDKLRWTRTRKNRNEYKKVARWKFTSFNLHSDTFRLELYRLTLTRDILVIILYLITLHHFFCLSHKRLIQGLWIWKDIYRHFE